LEPTTLDRHEVAQRLVHVLDQRIGHVDTESVHAPVRPETQNPTEFLTDPIVVPVQVGLFRGEHVQIPLSVRGSTPGRTSEGGPPVRGRLLTVLPTAVTEHVPFPLR